MMPGNLAPGRPASSTRPGPILVLKDGERTADLVARSEGRESYAIAVSGARGRQQRNLHLLARLIADDGFSVEVAVGVAHARRRLQASPAPVALVTDVSLPSPAAVETARAARLVVPGIPLFFVTSYPCLLESEPFDPAPHLFTKPLDYRAFLLELQRATRRQSGQVRRVDLSFADERSLASGAERDSWPG